MNEPGKELTEDGEENKPGNEGFVEHEPRKQVLIENKKENEPDQKDIEDEIEDQPDEKQIYSALSFFVMLVVVGIPLWWKTTEVYRVSLPYSEIDRLHELDVKIQMNIHVVTIDDDHGTALINDLKNIFRISKLYNFNFKQHSIDRALIGSSKSLEEIDEKIKHPKFEGSLQLYEIPGLSRFTAHNVILGQKRTIYFSSETDAYGLYNFLSSKILKEESLLTTMSPKSQSIKSHVSKNSKHKIPASDDYDILFTVINPDPNSLRINFDISEAIEEYISPLLKDLEDMNGFHVKSHWLYFVNLQVQMKFVNKTDKGPHFALSEDLLPHVITPLEKKLASHVSKHPCLNFVLFIPPCSASPIYIYTRRGYQVDGANAFISPRWGGIQIHNPDREACLNSSEAVQPDKHDVMTVFLEQLRLLLGISDPTQTTESEITTSNTAYLRQWEKDSLFRYRTIEQLTSAKFTLQSLSKLLEKISNIVINDQVGNAIYSALDNIYKATDALSNGKLVEGYNHSKRAFLSSETAFTDPSLLALLYFPDDQKYAVYIPLFLPVMIPVFISLKHIKKWLWKKPEQGPEAKLKDD